jgi:hypothetical protein
LTLRVTRAQTPTRDCGRYSVATANSSQRRGGGLEAAAPPHRLLLVVWPTSPLTAIDEMPQLNG